MHLVSSRAPLSDDALAAYGPPPGGAASEAAQAGERAWEYRLVSVVVHQGRGIDTGHYTALVNDSHAGVTGNHPGAPGSASAAAGAGGSSNARKHDPAKDTWTLVDDHHVSVLSSLAELRRAQAYLLVYERVEVTADSEPEPY